MRNGWNDGVPPSGGNCRKLVTLESDGMIWVGIRAFDEATNRAGALLTEEQRRAAFGGSEHQAGMPMDLSPLPESEAAAVRDLWEDRKSDHMSRQLPGRADRSWKMNDQQFIPLSERMPPKNESIEWITPSGKIERGKWAGGAVWFPDGSPMYVYYTPISWRPATPPPHRTAG